MKHPLQVFTNDRAIDLSIRKIITEEYLSKIKENKYEPQLAARNPVPPYIPVAIGIVGLGLTSESIRELPIAAQAVLAGIILMLIASYEISRSHV